MYFDSDFAGINFLIISFNFFIFLFYHYIIFL